MPNPHISRSGIVLFKNNKVAHLHLKGTNFDAPGATPTVTIDQKDSAGVVLRKWKTKVKPHATTVMCVRAVLDPSFRPEMHVPPYTGDESGTVEITVTNAGGASTGATEVPAVLLGDEIPP